MNQPLSFQRLFTLNLLAAASLLALSACGGSDDEETPTPSSISVSVVPSLGAIYNADTEATCAPTGASLGTGSTGSTGQVTVTSAAGATCAGPVLVKVSGKADNTSTYYDEATGSVLSFPAGSSLRAVLPSLSGSSATVGVSALTEIATRQALSTAGSLSALTSAQASTANTNVVTQVLGSGVSLNILEAPTLWTATTASGSLGTTAADRYAFYLAGLAKMGSGAPKPALAVTEALAADLADGTLSGTASGDFTYTAGGMAAQLNTGMRSLSAFANATLQGNLGITPVAMTVTAIAPATAAAGGTVKVTGTGFEADPFHMQVKFSNGVVADLVGATDSVLAFTIPANAASGPLTIVNGITKAEVTTSTSFTFTTSGGGGGGSDAWTSHANGWSFMLDSIAYGNGTFVGVGYGGTIVTSATGDAWTVQHAADTQFYEGTGVVWDGAQFVMVGDKNYGSTKPPMLATSPDGINWTRRDWASDYESKLVGVASGGGRLTAVGISGFLISSTDSGITWARETTSGIATFTAVAANSSTRVAVGRDGSYNGVILVNSGSGWTAASGVTDFMPYAITWSGTQFMAVGASNASFGADPVVMYSADGVSWTRHALASTESPAGFKLQSVFWTGSKYYAGGDNGGTKRVIVSSTDGSTWTKVYEETISGQAQIVGMASNGTRIIAIGGAKMVTLP